MVSSPLHTKIKNLTDDPGVYLMKDGTGGVLYIGKAKNLKSRVSSYFQEAAPHGPRIQLMVSKINDFEVVITDTETEALVLECNLIKKYKPKFNIRLRDDKAFPYVRLDVNHPFPRLEYVRRVKKDGARYFGPFVQAAETKQMLTWTRKTFGLRDCSDNEFRNRSRPCILHQIGQCSAPCVGFIDSREYGQGIEFALKVLDGRADEVLKTLRDQMAQAAQAEDFERAAQLRDQIQRITDITAEQKMLDPEGRTNRDVVSLSRDAQGGLAVVALLAVRDGRTVGVFQYPFQDIDSGLSDSEMLFEFLSQYYLSLGQIFSVDVSSGSHLGANDSGDELTEAPHPVGLPEEVLLPKQIEADPEFAHSYRLLNGALGRRVEFRCPKRGEAVALLDMVHKTSNHALLDLARQSERSYDDILDVQLKLKLATLPRRIECYDISHFQGEGTVASRVVFIEGRPEKKLYRHYHIETVAGPDDFASMFEVLSRRFSKQEGEGGALPDLVVIDGGRGQLAQAVAVFEQLAIAGVELVSLAKARTTGEFSDTEVKATMERVFKPGQKNPIFLKPGTGAFRVLTQIRDEAHRFAINFHRKTRDRKRIGGLSGKTKR
jgi:excinuclease ABC subunit C